MDTVQDFEDLLDLWVDPDPENVARANRVLAAYGSPFLLERKVRER